MHGYTTASGVTWLRRGDREAFPSLGAATLEHLTPFLGAHAHEKTMCFRAALAIRLERALALSHDVGSPATALESQRILNSSVPPTALSTKRRGCKGGFVGVGRVCYCHVPCEAVTSGLPPKFSTTVEKNVEKPRFSPRCHTGNTADSGVLRGEGRFGACFRHRLRFAW